MLFYNDITTGAIREILYDADKMDIVNAYSFGMLYKSREEAIQKRLEFLLLKRINSWVEEHQGDWKPDLKDDEEVKFYLAYECEYEQLFVYRAYSFQEFSKLPYFKSQEIADQFIVEFGDVIIEVFFNKQEN